MRQTDLMLIVQNMSEGQAIDLSREDLVSVAEGNLSSVLFDRVRDSDIEKFLSQIRQNWNVSTSRDLASGGCTLVKLPPRS